MGYNPWGHKEWDMTKHISELELNMTPFYSLDAEIHNINKSAGARLFVKERGIQSSKHFLPSEKAFSSSV